jgi:CBS domain-containing protein
VWRSAHPAQGLRRRAPAAPHLQGRTARSGCHDMAAPLHRRHHRRPNVRTTRVEDLMSRTVISLRPNDLIDIAKLDMDLAEIRHLPVIDEHQHVVGMVAASDVRRAIARRNGRAIVVSEVMTHPVVTIHRKSPAYDAVCVMLEQKIGALPVLGGQERLEGMLTETDFLRVAAEHLQGG